MSLEEREKRHSGHKEQLAREQRYLRRRLAQLRASRDVSRSLSESSMPHAHATRADSLSSLESSSGVSTAERSPSSVSESGPPWTALKLIWSGLAGYYPTDKDVPLSDGVFRCDVA
ncbi:jg15430 [Pararge aegeria aegeria]|uniref:Jg15430 protein n=1 Tax=Pararge aegeria aegeria TaxID=348720 RepID=A0A8S4SAJ2_9NEOP|nr:jg15430 [Pararge aegeria aegeria]